MAQEIIMNLVMVGHYAGKTVNINGHQFIDGTCRLNGKFDTIGFAVHYLSRYSAFPVGSDELKAAQAHYDMEVLNGDHGDTEAGSKPGPADAVQSHDKPSGSGTPAEAGPDGAEPIATDEGYAGVRANGDGHEDAGVPNEESGTIDPVDGDVGKADESGSADPEKAAEEVPMIDKALIAVVHALDPEVDEHWTQAGLPALAAITQAYGNPDVTRKEVDVIAWDRAGARETARAYAEFAAMNG